MKSFRLYCTGHELTSGLCQGPLVFFANTDLLHVGCIEYSSAVHTGLWLLKREATILLNTSCWVHMTYHNCVRGLTAYVQNLNFNQCASDYRAIPYTLNRSLDCVLVEVHAYTTDTSTTPACLGSTLRTSPGE